MNEPNSFRGFTLIELMVGLAIGAVLTTAATGVLVVARTSATEAALRAQMTRDAQLVIDAIGRDLGYLGAGVPLDRNADPFGTTPAAAPVVLGYGDLLTPTVRRGLPKNLVFVGDQPYPNSEVPGIASITRVRNQGLAGRVAFTNELTGPCTPPLTTAPAAFQCKTTVTTMMPGAYTAVDDCDSTQNTAKTCPWGMNKWQPGPSGLFLTFVSSNGHWWERKVMPAGMGSTFNEYVGIDLENDFPALGAGKVLASNFFNPVGSGYVTVMDRTFYAVENPGASSAGGSGAACTGVLCKVFRKQCWGRIEDTGAAGFPRAGGFNDFYGTSATINNCTAPGDGTDWEVLATGVELFNFRYYSTNATQIVNPNTDTLRGNIRAIEVEIGLSRKIPGVSPPRFVKQKMTRRFFLNNRQRGSI